MSETKKPEPTPPFDPMAYWHRAMADLLQRAQAFTDAFASLEAQAVQRAQSAVASWAQMTQDAIAYAAQLSADARKVGMDAARKTSAGA